MNLSAQSPVVWFIVLIFAAAYSSPRRHLGASLGFAFRSTLASITVRRPSGDSPPLPALAIGGRLGNHAGLKLCVVFLPPECAWVQRLFAHPVYGVIAAQTEY